MQSTSYQHIDLEYLELMCEEDIEMKKIMLGMLLEEIPAELAKMRPLYESRDWEELNAVSHKFKSTLAFIGNADMTNANKTIEYNSKTLDNTEAIPACIGILEDFQPKVLYEIKQELEKH